MTTVVSSFVLATNADLQEKINSIKIEHEQLNKHADVIIEILGETTENCASGCKMYTFKMEIEDNSF